MPPPPPLVSIIIPTYRHEQYVEATLASVFAQTFRDFEVIVINDGSPDATAARLKPLADSGRIRYFDQTNIGQSATRNRAIALARGQFIALLDDDDLWPPDKLAWQVANLQAHPDSIFCYGFAQSFGLDQNYRLPATPGPHGKVDQLLLDGNPIISPGQVLVRTSALLQAGSFDPSIRGTEDWDLWIRLARLGPVTYEDRCSLHYRLHGMNDSRHHDRIFAAGIQVLHKHVGRLPIGTHCRQWLRTRHYIGMVASTIALGRAHAESAGRHPLASAKHLAAALRYHPSLLLTKRLWSAITRLMLTRA